MKSKINLEISLGFTVLFLFLLYYIFMYTWIPRYPDPFGYLANAAFFSGKEYDWKSISQQMGMVYSGGYSIIIIPFMKIINDILALIKSLFVLNALFLGMMFLVLVKITNIIYEDNEHGIMIFVCFCICISPMYSFYVCTVTPEILLDLIFVSTSYNIIRMSRRNNNRILYFLTSLELGFSLFVHVRFLIIVISFILISILFLYEKKIHIRTACLGFLIMIASIYGQKLFNGYLGNNVYGINSNDIGTTANTLQTQYTKLYKYILNGDRIWAVLANTFTQYFYVIISTFFLGGVLLLITLKVIKKFYKHENIEIYIVWTILCSWMMLAASSYSAMNAKRWDHLLYGRYIAPIVPMIVVSCAKEIKSINPKKCMVLGFAVALICELSGYILNYRIIKESITNSIPRSILGITLIYNWLGSNYENFIVLGKITALLAIFISMGLALRYQLITNKFISSFLLLLLAIFEIGSSMHAFSREIDETEPRNKYTEFIDIYNYDDLKIYVTQDSWNYLNQLMAYDKSVTIIDDEADISEDLNGNFIIFDKANILEGNMFSFFINTDVMKGNIYVGGDDYINYLENEGYQIGVIG